MIKKIFALMLSFCMIFCFTACGDNEDFEAKGDYLTGNSWEGTDGTLIELETDGTYKFYNSSADTSNNYYSGKFEVKSGQNAIDYLEEEWGVGEEGQRSVMEKYLVKDEFYYVLIMNHEKCMIDGQNTLSEPSKTEYFGYYSEYDGHLNFTSLKTMGAVNFYKK